MDYIELESVTSTNTWAKEHLSELSPNPVVCITANQQTGGRGRLNRSWVSPQGQNLYATFVFYLPAKTPMQNLSQIISLSCAHVLRHTGFTAQIKWPNDILISGKKCAGVLCEIVGEYAILGIGLNINMPKELCEAIDQPATSLLVEKHKEFSITAMRNDLAKEFEHDLKVFLSNGFAPFQNAYNDLLASKDKPITLDHAGRPLTGIIKGVSSDGCLELELENGDMMKTTDYEII
ncbi:MAG: biotin--[acetyl-CoA-carboxylase] ligase [Chlamydiia bacterium]|nr:biotin--[acetyl-CoA-carboxylase] ligase [Chlamydiia bacterium]MCP5509625.1 biotin--[acetyl-CoA-carboxylase] ligase [Chlamydiales bacterium]HPE84573.1 biotin--[acetyl-CoA-carboxylase] ligase [Chlamydiales bacterium]